MATPIPAKAVLEFTPRPRTLPVAYLPISGDVAAAERAGSAEACVITTGRFSVAARALAEE